MLRLIVSAVLVASVITTSLQLNCPTCRDTADYCRINYTVQSCLYRSPFKFEMENLTRMVLRYENTIAQHFCLDAYYGDNFFDKLVRMCILVPDIATFCDKYEDRGIKCLVSKRQGQMNGEILDEYEDWGGIEDSANHINKGFIMSVLISVIMSAFI